VACFIARTLYNLGFWFGFLKAILAFSDPSRILLRKILFVLGLVIYFAYAIWHSRILIDEQTTGTQAPGPLGPGANSPSRELERKVSLEVEVDERTPLLIP
jgi:hypothetical protein